MSPCLFQEESIYDGVLDKNDLGLYDEKPSKDDLDLYNDLTSEDLYDDDNTYEDSKIGTEDLSSGIFAFLTLPYTVILNTNHFSKSLFDLKSISVLFVLDDV